MKTLKEFFKEIEDSNELQEELKALKDVAAVEAFLKKHDCNATAEELAKQIKAKAEGAQGELSDEDVSSVAGGVWYDFGFGWVWVDETIPERKKKTDQTLPEFKITIEDEI